MPTGRRPFAGGSGCAGRLRSLRAGPTCQDTLRRAPFESFKGKKHRAGYKWKPKRHPEGRGRQGLGALRPPSLAGELAKSRSLPPPGCTGLAASGGGGGPLSAHWHELERPTGRTGTGRALAPLTEGVSVTVSPLKTIKNYKDQKVNSEHWDSRVMCSHLLLWVSIFFYKQIFKNFYDPLYSQRDIFIYLWSQVDFWNFPYPPVYPATHVLHLPVPDSCRKEAKA